MKIKTIHFLVIFLLSFNFIQAQINEGGTPLSFDPSIKIVISKSIPSQTMPAVDVDVLVAEDLVNDQNKNIPWRFGFNIPVNYNTANSGVWDILSDGRKIWRLNIVSTGALSINLNFNDFQLPLGAKLFIYSTDKSQILGAFTKQNNQADHNFATTLIESDDIIIEYNEPSNPEYTGTLSVDRVTHGYRSAYMYAKAFGDAGACNFNAVCPLSAGWESQIRSACMLVTGGNGFCSGALVNNTSNDGTPYILTADHCYSNPTAWVFWFNWQSATCANPGSSPSYNAISGATLISRDATSDFCLVQMSSVPPLNYNVFYAGWNNSTTPATSTACIHHPSGDIKKFSTAGTAVSALYSGKDTWNVNWIDGVTEPGSSGSPLFDQNKRIIGQLYGGPSACGQSPGNLNDYFGKLSTSWNGAGTPTTRLKDWLDPVNSGTVTNDGWDPNGLALPVANFNADVTTTCTGTINFTDASSNSPIAWAWDFGDGGTSNAQNPTHNYTANGTYSVQLIATNSIGSDTLFITNYITVNHPVSPTVTPDGSCNPAILHLAATGSGALTWWDAPTGGTLVYTGTNYTTPLLTNTITYYVESDVSSSPVNGGKPNNTGGGGNSTLATRYEIFDCFAPTTLVSVDVYASTTGNRTFELRNSSGTVLQSATVNITSTSGAFTVPLNFNIPVGTNLQLGLNSGSNANLYRNNAGVSYPYTTPGLISVTTSNATTNPQNYYYYVYNWVLQAASCISSRVPVTASIFGNPAINLGVDTIVCANATITLDAGAGYASYNWSNGTNGQTITIDSTGVGLNTSTYLVTVTDNNGCIGYDTIAVSFQICSDINEINANGGISVYPNPANDLFTVTNMFGSAEIKLYSVDGKLLVSLSSDKNKTPIDISRFSKGIYIYSISNERGKVIGKLAIE